MVMEKQMETRSSVIGKSWLKQYNTSNQTETIDIKEVYNLCVLSNPKQNDIDIGSFISISEIIGIKTSRDRNKKHKFFFAKSISGGVKQYHGEFKNHGNKEPQYSADFYVINIRELINKKKENKTEILRKLMESGTNMKIITITALILFLCWSPWAEK